MKKNLCVLIAICIFLLCGCGNTKKEGEVTSDKSVNELADLIQEKTEYAMTMKIELDNEDDFSLLESSIGLNRDWMKDAVLLVNMMVTADTLFIAEANSVDDAQLLEEAFIKQRDSVIQSFYQYLPEQEEKAKKGQVVRNGKYVMLVVSEDNDSAIEIFNKHTK